MFIELKTVSGDEIVVNTERIILLRRDVNYSMNKIQVDNNLEYEISYSDYDKLKKTLTARNEK